jgi:protein-S-isoprenylcysteine O-methyltransferase Ste14
LRKTNQYEFFRGWGAGSAIILSFIVAMEIVIMISPFAFFFYAVFNPFLLVLNHSYVTRWLTAFFLPHMIIPPVGLLIIIRIFGSVLFVTGTLVFLICAIQVYGGKLLRKGPANKGLYALIRHPQYVALSLAAIGLAIMWPRFLTLVLLAVMIFLYYILARNEERRMSNRFSKDYNEYLNRTGMFLPRKIEKIFIKNPDPNKRTGIIKEWTIFLLLCTVLVGSGFLLRAYTVYHLPLTEFGNVDVIAISTEDLTKADEIFPAILRDSVIVSKLNTMPDNNHNRILAYFIPIDYMMQGMIANTGNKWKLFEQHKTIGMIMDYIFHPYAHLTGEHTHNFIDMNMQNGIYSHPMMKRRIIFIEVNTNYKELKSPYNDFNFNIKRRALFFADIDLHTGIVLQILDTPSGSSWGTVPTPLF